MSAGYLVPQFAVHDPVYYQHHLDALNPSMLMLQGQASPDGTIKMQRAKTSVDSYYDDPTAGVGSGAMAAAAAAAAAGGVGVVGSGAPLSSGGHISADNGSDYLLSSPRHAGKRHSMPVIHHERNSSSSSVVAGGPFQTPLRRGFSPGTVSSVSTSGLMTPYSVASSASSISSSASSWGLLNSATTAPSSVDHSVSLAHHNNPHYHQHHDSSSMLAPHSHPHHHVSHSHHNSSGGGQFMTPMTPNQNRRYTDFGTAGVKLDFSSAVNKNASRHSVAGGAHHSGADNGANGDGAGAGGAASAGSTGINPFYKPSAYISQSMASSAHSASHEFDTPVSTIKRSASDPGLASGSVSPATTLPGGNVAEAAAEAARAALEVQNYTPPLSAAPSLTHSESSSVPGSPHSPIYDMSGAAHPQSMPMVMTPHVHGYSSASLSPQYPHRMVPQYYDMSMSEQVSLGSPVRRGTGVLLDGAPSHKPHKCHQCSKCFKRLEHLKRHLRIHTDERSHVCDVPGCNRRFSRSDNLRAHRRTHMKRGGRNLYVEGLEESRS